VRRTAKNWLWYCNEARGLFRSHGFNRNLSDKAVYIKLLNDNGFDGETLVKQVDENKDNVKERIFENNKRAIEAGCCGIPSYQIDGGDMLFGQDQYHILEESLAASAKL
jgi:2-hydroxychromene-2-carboxylate isomerase